MNNGDLQGRLLILGSEDLRRRPGQAVSHLLRIINPGNKGDVPVWFSGAVLDLWFGDVTSVEDAECHRTTPPTAADIRQGIAFAHAAWQGDGAVLFSCDYGASRSPAMAYAALAAHLGPGAEQQALEIVISVRPEAVPNRLVVQIADDLLGCRGKLLLPLKAYYRKIEREITAASMPPV